MLIQASKSEAEAKTAATKAAEAQKAAESDRTAAGTKLQELIAFVKELEQRHEEVNRYKALLNDLAEQNKALNAKAESLLPHAASAGLASAFREQKARFKTPQRFWLSIFIFSIALLFALAVPEFWRELGKAAATVSISWDDLLRQLLHRLPLVIPLVWLAIYAGRNYTIAAKLEEDYAYKEAVSTAFEGYKREMGNIPTDGHDGASPLRTLCENVLGALSQRPGRIYEGEHQDVTPITPALSFAEKFMGKKSPETKPIPTRVAGEQKSASASAAQ